MPKITLIGHSTVLIEMAGARILTDPWFNHWGNVFYQRLARPAQPAEMLRDVDLVLVSHDHWDHQDPEYLHSLTARTAVVVPKILKPIFSLERISRLVGLAPWECQHFGPIQVTAVPAIHSPGAGGYVFQAGRTTIYFSGDTFYGKFLEDIGARFNITAALIPVTTYRIPMTINMDGALKATQAIHPEIVFPVHLGITPRLPAMRTRDNVEGYCQKIINAGLNTKVIMLHEGESADL